MHVLNHPLVNRKEVLSVMSGIIRQSHRLRAIEQGLIKPAFPSVAEFIAMADHDRCSITFWDELEFQLNMLEPEHFGVFDDSRFHLERTKFDMGEINYGVDVLGPEDFDCPTCGVKSHPVHSLTRMIGH